MSGGPWRRNRVAPVLVSMSLPHSCRIMASHHRWNPLGTSPADSRFCTRNGGFTALYAAPEFLTAFVETVVRDRFTRRQNCEITLKEITTRIWARIATQPEVTLKLVDLRRDGCTRIGATTDTVNAKNHAAGRAFARDIHAGHADVDGIVYASRLTGEDVYAVFGRSTGKLVSLGTSLLEDHPELPDILERYRIGLVR